MLIKIKYFFLNIAIVVPIALTTLPQNVVENCPICLSALDDDVHKTVCNHLFHKECIKKSNDVKKVCPICRGDLSEAWMLIKWGIAFSYTSRMGISKYLSKNERKGQTERFLFSITFERGDKKIVIEDYECPPDNLPIPYDVLRTSPRRDPEDFEEFCGAYRYEEDSRNAYFIWEETTKQYENFLSFFTSIEMEIIANIE